MSDLTTLLAAELGFAAFIVGAVIGSFLNVVIGRVPAGHPITTPSRCPSCDTPIAKRDNLPVIGWLLLRGEARCCANPISARYPIIEAATGAAFALVALTVDPARWAVAVVAVATLIAVGVIDADTKTIPNKIIWPAGIAVAALTASEAALGGHASTLWGAAAGAAVFGGFLFLVFMLAPAGGFGFGDVRLGTFIGVVVGPAGVAATWLTVLAGFASGSIVGVALIAAGKVSRKTPVPFGPFLCAAGFLGLILGPHVPPVAGL